VGEDRPPTRRRTTVAEAAELMGISTEAVRGRIRRGTLPVEREGGAVYVLLDDRTTTDQPRTTTGQDDDRLQSDSSALISELRAHNATLQAQLESERQAHAEARRLLMAALDKLPAIEPPSEAAEEPPEASETSRPQSGRVGPSHPSRSLREP
jgi:hypothetical protein